MIKVLIADDHGLFRKGIMKILDGSGVCRVIGEAENGKELIDKYFELNPDIILVDISMPGLSGIDALAEIIKQDKYVKALFLTMYDDEQYVYKVIKAGGRGLINKNYLEEDLFSIIQRIYEGELYFGEKWNKDDLPELMSKYANDDFHQDLDSVNKLSEREKEIFLLIGKGYSSNQISDSLCIAKRTVDTHRTHMYDKLGVKSFHDLFRFAVEYTLSKKAAG